VAVGCFALAACSSAGSTTDPPATGGGGGKGKGKGKGEGKGGKGKQEQGTTSSTQP